MVSYYLCMILVVGAFLVGMGTMSKLRDRAVIRRLRNENEEILARDAEKLRREEEAKQRPVSPFKPRVLQGGLSKP